MGDRDLRQDNINRREEEEEEEGDDSVDADDELREE